jgi:hypothetical protein
MHVHMLQLSRCTTCNAHLDDDMSLLFIYAQNELVAHQLEAVLHRDGLSAAVLHAVP